MSDHLPSVDPPPTSPDVGPSHLDVVVVDDGRERVVFVAGTLAMAEGGKLREAIAPHLVAGELLELDLSGVTLLGAEGVTTLLEWVRDGGTAQAGAPATRSSAGP